MAGVKISALPMIPSSNLSDIAPFVQAGTTYCVVASISDSNGVIFTTITNATTFVVHTSSRGAGTAEDHAISVNVFGTQ